MTSTSAGDLKKIQGILFRFLLWYVLLFGTYRLVLSFSAPDVFTRLTAGQVNGLYHLTGMHTERHLLPDHRQIGITWNGRWAVNIIEGCNGMSIIILFWAFVWAFPVPVRRRLAFSVAGVAAIWLMNLFRIWLLGLIYLHRPGDFGIAHRVFFPAVIYGTVVVLWLIWVRRLRKADEV